MQRVNLNSQAFYASQYVKTDSVAPVADRLLLLPEPRPIDDILREQLEHSKKPLKKSEPESYNIGAVVGWCNKHDINIPNILAWRWLDGILGEINGLPSSRGRAMVTDGVIVLIETADGIYRGHMGFFKPDDDGPCFFAKISKNKKSKVSKPAKAPAVDISEFI
jgi:hypothetical protein